ncbi:MAG TPA: diphthine synthase [Candidatus Nanoarchaeia archaeon]|nr:diphthine synthase [Candidatus Nanoarchaeia archaeon]
MVLYIIGLGLSHPQDISLKGLELIKQSDLVYLESYTSRLQCPVKDLEELYGKKIILADRVMAEQGMELIITEAETKKISFLIIGDPFSATTHIELFKLAQDKKVAVEVVNNASILTAVGITGLQLYKFGKITSIPFLEDFPQLETPYNILQENKSISAHTLFLLDIKSEQNKLMTVNQSLEILEQIELRKNSQLINSDTLVIGCARLGSSDFKIKSGKLSEVKKYNFGLAPHCLIIPSKMHFSEEEMVARWG